MAAERRIARESLGCFVKFFRNRHETVKGFPSEHARNDTDTAPPRDFFARRAVFPVDCVGVENQPNTAHNGQADMAKYRLLDEIRADLDACRALLEDLQTRGDAACTAYDLSLGYDAE